MRKLFVFEDKNLDKQVQEIVQSATKPLPVFANNAAALAGGLKAGTDYRTETGTRMVVY